jgi:hypothetical protein
MIVACVLAQLPLSTVRFRQDGYVVTRCGSLDQWPAAEASAMTNSRFHQSVGFLELLRATAAPAQTLHLLCCGIPSDSNSGQRCAWWPLPMGVSMLGIFCLSRVSVDSYPLLAGF